MIPPRFRTQIRSPTLLKEPIYLAYKKKKTWRKYRNKGFWIAHFENQIRYSIRISSGLQNSNSTPYMDKTENWSDLENQIKCWIKVPGGLQFEKKHNRFSKSMTRKDGLLNFLCLVSLPHLKLITLEFEVRSRFRDEINDRNYEMIRRNILFSSRKKEKRKKISATR